MSRTTPILAACLLLVSCGALTPGGSPSDPGAGGGAAERGGMPAGDARPGATEGAAPRARPASRAETEWLVAFEGQADVPLLPGARETVTLRAGRTPRGGGEFQPKPAPADLDLLFEVDGATLMTVAGEPVERALRLPKGARQVALQVQLAEEASGTEAWNAARVRLREVRSVGGDRVDVGPAPNSEVRLWARGARSPVMSIGHATPETWPHPVAKVQRRGSEGYWGFRMLDADVRTASGDVGGGRAAADEPLELVLALTGDARVGHKGDGETDVILYDHQLSGDGGPGRTGPPLKVKDGQVVLQVEKGAPGWALWGVFPDVEDAGVQRTLQLRMVELRGTRTGRRYDIGWNDRGEWAIVP